MEKCKNYGCYMFACEGGCNILVEAETKIEAIQKFQEDFKMKFNGDWKVFSINVKLGIEGDFKSYYS